MFRLYKNFKISAQYVTIWFRSLKLMAYIHVAEPTTRIPRQQPGQEQQEQQEQRPPPK